MVKSVENQLVERISNVLSDATISTAEMDALLEAQQGLSTHQSDTKIAAQLKTELSLLAAQKKLSPQSIDLLTWISKSYPGWGKRGMGLTNLFMS